ncbi:hypothetical protein SAMN02745217_04665 [Anaerocolumna xylanovorans DSM 12503]|uniref:Arc-like DNA binding domain-containing protein n=2 Tax=Anaerocolumna TaxID=1843210 RepID=A0A1M7YNL4_9FIRM|nr:hypothetical protein [Anaerocolumna xylanovorans]SHO54209.1 hypothetical protein SAMN02745217_04665 [Anaerocolumna xylanovorans DSM 12503]
MAVNNEGNVEKREEELKKRLEKVREMEQELLQKEKKLKEKEKSKKQILLRLSPVLWNELAAWAEDDYRSINGQIEFLLSECVKKRKGT